MARFPERLDNLLAHFAAARPEAGADRRHEITRIGPEFPDHGCDRFRADPLHGAAPAGMHGGHRARAPIPDQNPCRIGNRPQPATPPPNAAEESSLTTPSACGGVQAPVVAPALETTTVRP